MLNNELMGEVLREYEPNLLRHAEEQISKSLRQRIDAWDILQHSYVRGAKKFPVFLERYGFEVSSEPTSIQHEGERLRRDVGSGRLRMFVYRQVDDAIAELSQLNTREKRTPAFEQDYSSLLEWSGTGPTTASSRKEVVELVRHVFKSWSKESDVTYEEVALIRLHHIEGRTYREIIDELHLNTSPGTLSVKVLRSLQRFGKYFQENVRDTEFGNGRR